jgi:hypothetical protein
MKWTLLDNFGHFSSHIWTLLRYMFPLITCVINKQMLILLLDTLVSILLKYYLKIELRIKKWTLLDTLKHIWTLFRYMFPLIKCVKKKQIQILHLVAYVFICLKDYLIIELRIKKWTLLDTFFVTFAHTFGPFLDICVYLIKCVINKQILILLLETYVSI